MEISAAHASSEFSDDLRALSLEVHELERRVSALEHGSTRAEAPSPPPQLPVTPLKLDSDALRMAGFALLGIGGAYLLRALSELGSVPRGIGVSASLAYSAAWLWLAARTPKRRKLAVGARISTAVVIFAPLVWESVMRFHTLPAWLAATLLSAFCIAAESVSWHKDLRAIAAITPMACAALAIALLIRTHESAPFTLSLVSIAAMMEFAAIEERANAARWPVAFCANAAVFLLMFVMSRRGGPPEEYPGVSVAFTTVIQASLPIVYGASAIVRTVLERRQFGILEIGQTATAFSLGFSGIIAITDLRAPAGAFAFAAGAACYAISMRVADRRTRNVYATFGLLLLASAAWLAFAGLALCAVWSALAIAVSFRCGAHAAILLWLALIGSHIAVSWAVQFFASDTQFPAVAAAIAIVAAAVCYPEARRPIDALFIAASFAIAATGFVGGFLDFPGSGTIILTLAAIGLAWIGASQHRKELVWLTYAFIGAAAFRIIGRDLPSSTAIELVAPLLAFGAALILLPRILQACAKP